VVKSHSSTVKLPLILSFLNSIEVGGMWHVAVKCLDMSQNTDSEGSSLGLDWRSGTKAWGANRIRYPGSPRRKLSILVLGDFGPRGLSESDKYCTWGVRSQGWNSKELTGARTSGGACGLIRWYARNLTRA